MDGGYYNLTGPRFSRQWWVHVGRNLLWISIVTVLIWVFADMKFSDVRPARVVLRVTAGENSGMVLLSAAGEQISHQDVVVVLTLKGSRDSLDLFERELGERLTYNVARSSKAGRLQIPTADILADLPIISENNLVVSSPKPPVVTVWLDRQVRQELPVDFVYSGAELAEKPKATVAVIVSQSNWKRIEAATANATPALRTANKDLAAVETSKPVQVDFEIIPRIGQIPVKLESKTVRVEVEITQRTQTKKLTVTVGCIGPPAWSWDGTWGRYELVGENERLEWRKEITVRGARKDLDRLEAKDIDAYIKLTEDDKAPVSWLRRPAIVRFPAELSVELVSGRPTVSFKLVDRAEQPADANDLP